MICMHYDHNQFFGVLKFQLGYRKLYLNSPKGYGRKIINSQTDYVFTKITKMASMLLSKITFTLYVC